MKLSKLRAKARSAFARGSRWIRYRTDDGVVHDGKPDDVVSIPVAVVRGRIFTRPQVACTIGGCTKVLTVRNQAELNDRGRRIARGLARELVNPKRRAT